MTPGSASRQRRPRAWRLLLLLAASAHAPAAAQLAHPPPHTAPRRLQLRDWVRHPPVVQAERPAGNLRIVSGAPNVTEICCALGLRRQLVGRTRYCNYPPDIRNLPQLGALNDTSLELLLALKPDLILLAGRSRALRERLGNLGLRIESLPDTSLADIFHAIRRAGALTGRPATARRLCAGLRAELQAVARRFAASPPARVLLLTGTLADPPAPPFVAGPGSFYDDLIRRAGHHNVVGPAGSAFAPLALEFILRADPDVIIELDASGTARPRGDRDAERVWARLGPLQAVRHHRVHVLTGRQHLLAGPRVAQTFYALCRAIAGGQPHEQDE